MQKLSCLHGRHIVRELMVMVLKQFKIAIGKPTVARSYYLTYCNYQNSMIPLNASPQKPQVTSSLLEKA